MIDDDRRDPDEHERAQAAALAEALEGRGAHEVLPEEVVEVAALLRYGGSDGELDAGRAEAIYEDLVREGLPPRAALRGRPGERGQRGERGERGQRGQRGQRGPRVATWLVGLGAGLAAAAAMLIGLLSTDLAEAPSSARQIDDAPAAAVPSPASGPSPLPAPPASLLSAQARASGDPAAREALDTEMARYRERVLRDLEARYPAAVGMLADPDRRGAQDVRVGGRR